MYIRNVGYVRRLFVEYVNGKRLEIIFNFFLSRNYVFVYVRRIPHSMGKERRLLNGSLIGRRSSSCSFRLYWFLWFNFVEHIPYPDTHIKDNRMNRWYGNPFIISDITFSPDRHSPVLQHPRF